MSLEVSEKRCSMTFWILPTSETWKGISVVIISKFGTFCFTESLRSRSSDEFLRASNSEAKDKSASSILEQISGWEVGFKRKNQQYKDIKWMKLKASSSVIVSMSGLLHMSRIRRSDGGDHTIQYFVLTETVWIALFFTSISCTSVVDLRDDEFKNFFCEVVLSNPLKLDGLKF